MKFKIYQRARMVVARRGYGNRRNYGFCPTRIGRYVYVEVDTEGEELDQDEVLVRLKP